MSGIQLDAVGYWSEEDFRATANFSPTGRYQVLDSEESKSLADHVTFRYPQNLQWKPRIVEMKSSNGHKLFDIGPDGSAGAPDNNRDNDNRSSPSDGSADGGLDKTPEKSWRGKGKVGVHKDGSSTEVEVSIKAENKNGGTFSASGSVNNNGQVKASAEYEFPFQ